MEMERERRNREAGRKIFAMGIRDGCKDTRIYSKGRNAKRKIKRKSSEEGVRFRKKVR